MPSLFRDGIVQILQFPVLLLQVRDAPLQVQLPLHDLRDVHAVAEDGQAVVPALHDSALVQYPEQAAVLPGYPVDGGVLHAHMVIVSQVTGDPLQVLIVDGVGHLALDGRLKFLIGAIAHHTVQLPAGEVQQKAFLAVAADHADGLDRSQKGDDLCLVALRQLQIAVHIVLADMQGSQQGLPGSLKLLRTPGLLRRIPQDTAVKRPILLFFQKEEFHIQPDKAPLGQDMPEAAGTWVHFAVRQSPTQQRPVLLADILHDAPLFKFFGRKLLLAHNGPVGGAGLPPEAFAVPAFKNRIGSQHPVQDLRLQSACLQQAPQEILSVLDMFLVHIGRLHFLFQNQVVHVAGEAALRRSFSYSGCSGVSKYVRMAVVVSA